MDMDIWLQIWEYHDSINSVRQRNHHEEHICSQLRNRSGHSTAQMARHLRPLWHSMSTHCSQRQICSQDPEPAAQNASTV